MQVTHKGDSIREGQGGPLLHNCVPRWTPCKAMYQDIQSEIFGAPAFLRHCREPALVLSQSLRAAAPRHFIQEPVPWALSTPIMANVKLAGVAAVNSLVSCSMAGVPFTRFCGDPVDMDMDRGYALSHDCGACGWFSNLKVGAYNHGFQQAGHC
jgi:hypothetical protein